MLGVSFDTKMAQPRPGLLAKIARVSAEEALNRRAAKARKQRERLSAAEALVRASWLQPPGVEGFSASWLQPPGD
jgi:hypothetical protein